VRSTGSRSVTAHIRKLQFCGSLFIEMVHIVCFAESWIGPLFFAQKVSVRYAAEVGPSLP